MHSHRECVHVLAAPADRTAGSVLPLHPLKPDQAPLEVMPVITCSHRQRSVAHNPPVETQGSTTIRLLTCHEHSKALQVEMTTCSHHLPAARCCCSSNVFAQRCAIAAQLLLQHYDM